MISRTSAASCVDFIDESVAQFVQQAAEADANSARRTRPVAIAVSTLAAESRTVNEELEREECEAPGRGADPASHSRFAASLSRRS